MTIAELIEILEAVPEAERDRPVVLQKDAEGNSYSPLQGGEQTWYEPTSTWSGECPHHDDLKSGEVELSKAAVKALVLWPVN